MSATWVPKNLLPPACLQALERVETELLAMRTSARQAASSADDRVRSLAHEAAAAADAASELKRQLAERQEIIESLLDGRERSVAQANIQLSALERQLAGKESERASLANSLRSQGVLVDALESELATVRQQVI